MQMVDSKQQELTSEQIIEIAAANTKVGRPIKEVKEMLTVEFSMPNIWKMRNGNTIFIVHKTKEPGYGFFRALNADTARNFLENSRVFADAAYKVGFDVVVTQFTDLSLLGLFKAIARDPVREGMGYSAQKTTDGGLQVTLVLGPARGNKQ
jgi:hypothetical protein